MASLYLLPNLLDPSGSIEEYFPPRVALVVENLQGLIAESEKEARRYLRRFVSHEKMQTISIALLNEHTQEIAPLLAPLKRGESWGLISDAGLCCIADPGSDLVSLCRQSGIEVQTFAGPSSIFMALQLSGFRAQNFFFHGYLPKEITPLQEKIKEMEKEIGTHIWIEAPYRSAKMLQILKDTLGPKKRLCLAASLCSPHQRVVCAPIDVWRKNSFVLEKEPVVFLLGE